MTTTHTITHITGYGATTEDGPGEPIVEILTVTVDDLADLLGSDELAAELLSTGRLGQHDEWTVQA